MSHLGRTGTSAARHENDAELLERIDLLRELTDELVAFPNAQAPRAALRHRLRTLEEASLEAGHMPLVGQIRRALACLQGDDEPSSGRQALAKQVSELQMLVAALPGVAARPHDDTVDNAGVDAESLVVDPRSAAPRPEGFRDVFFEPLDVGEAQSQRPIELTQTVAGVIAAPTVVSVLVVDEPACVDRIVAGLRQDAYEVIGTADAEQAIALARSHSPDVVLVAQALAEDRTLRLVERLRGESAANKRRVLLLSPRGGQAIAARLGCDAWVRTPVEPLLMDALLERLLGRGGPRPSALQELTEGTVDDVAQRLTDEIRRGLCDSLQVGRDERISLEDTRELMSAAWSAIGRVRTHLAQRSMGKVRFADHGEGFLDGAAPQVAEMVDAGAVADTQLMVGQRILVADDDPAVLWFFAGLLREAGALVWEAKNGREALEIAERRRPHVVISDILMPKLDGFALCRELKRHVTLWDVPVILLSWKEDFLLRMRELQSGAAGYLRKEAGSRQILATVGDVLRPRARFREQLTSEAVVSGRIDRHSVLTLLELAASDRGDVAVKVQDAYNLYEIQIRDGEHLSATRTATDGSFCRGMIPLRQVLGVRSGRFDVSADEGPLRGAFELPLAEALERAACEMSALVDAVSGPQLMRVGRVELDDELLSMLWGVLPASAVEVVEFVRDTQSTLRDHVISGDLSAHVAEEQLVELVRAGVVLAVTSVDGEDLVAEAFAEAHGRITSSQSAPPADTDLGAPAVDAPVVLVEEQDVDAAVDSELFDESTKPREERPSNRPRRETEVLTFAVADDDDSDEVAQEAVSGEAGEMPVESASLAQQPLDPVAANEKTADSTSRAQVDATNLADSRATPPSSPPPIAVETASSLRSPSMRSGTAAEWASRLSIVLTVAALAALGYFGVRALGLRFMAPGSAESAANGLQIEVADGPQLNAQQSPARENAQKGVDEPVSRLVAAPGDVGRMLPFIDRTYGVEVAENEGLLVVNCGDCQDAPTVRIGKRTENKTPLAIALPEGRHEMVLSYDGRTRYRYLEIVRGQTRVVDVL